jgi:CRP-like cAMP-binding protein
LIPVDRLSRHELLAHFGAAQLERLAEALEERAIEAGTTLLRQGEGGREAYLLESGHVRIQRSTPYGLFPLAQLDAGDIFGEAGFVDAAQRSGDAVATTPCRLLVFSYDELAGVFERDPRFAMAVYWTIWRSLSVKLRRTNEKLGRFFSHGGRPGALEAGGDRVPTGEFRIDLAAKRSLFAEQKLTSLEINFLTSLSREKKLAPGEVLFREGDPGDAMYVVLEGRIRISKMIPGAGEEALAILERGDYFGEMALIDRQPRSALAKAHDAGAVVLAIPKNVVEGLLDIRKVSSLALLHILCALVAKRLREIDDKLVGWYILAGGNWPSAAL